MLRCFRGGGGVVSDVSNDRGVLKTSGSAHPDTERHLLEDLHPQQDGCHSKSCSSRRLKMRNSNKTVRTSTRREFALKFDADFDCESSVQTD
jgi:hypothetical protein